MGAGSVTQQYLFLDHTPWFCQSGGLFLSTETRVQAIGLQFFLETAAEMPSCHLTRSVACFEACSYGLN